MSDNVVHPHEVGGVAEALSPVAAEAVRAAFNGASVSEAYQKAGITLPSEGAPVTHPIPASDVQAGDVGAFKDHLVMSLGNGKVLVSGQQQPLESVSSEPGFLGWFDPTAQLGSAVRDDLADLVREGRKHPYKVIAAPSSPGGLNRQ